MDIGQIGFHDQRNVLKVKVEKKMKDVINRLEKTRQERNPDLQAEKQAYEDQSRGKRRAEERAQRQLDKQAKEEERCMAEMRSYKTRMKEDNMVSNTELKDKYSSVQEHMKTTSCDFVVWCSVCLAS
eukprot:jgi/Chrzof1/8027/UNPLg00072.t1